MVFIETADGEKAATATAYHDITGRDKSGSGWLHWVAVRRERQGKGLAKPLILHVLGIMRNLGHTMPRFSYTCEIFAQKLPMAGQSGSFPGMNIFV